MLPLPDSITRYIEADGPGRPTKDFYNWLKDLQRIASVAPAAALRDPPPADNTIYISPTGDDGNDGTASSPIKTWIWASQLIGRYDWQGNTVKIKVVDPGTFDFAANNDDGYYGNLPIVGAQCLPMVLIEGYDPSDPTQTVFDDNGRGAAGINLPPGSRQLVCFNGIQFQNFGITLNNQAPSGILMPGNSRYVDCSNITWDNEAGGAIISGGVVIGGPPKMSFAGSHSQLLYNGGSWVDFDDAIVEFEPGCSFSYAVFNVASGGTLNWHDNGNQGFGTNPSGVRGFISGGGIIIANTYDQSTRIYPDDMPGDDPLFNLGGYFNNVNESSWNYVVADLPTPGIMDPVRAIVTDATSTTFHSNVVGGGANQVPVYYDFNSSSWRIG